MLRKNPLARNKETSSIRETGTKLVRQHQPASKALLKALLCLDWPLQITGRILTDVCRVARSLTSAASVWRRLGSTRFGLA